MDADWKTDPNYDKMRRVLDAVAVERARLHLDIGRGEARRQLREDLIYAAAVAVAWAESLTEERQP